MSKTNLQFTKLLQKLKSMCLLSASIVVGQHPSSATFWGWGSRSGAYDLEIWTQPRFFNNAHTHHVSSSYG